VLSPEPAALAAGALLGDSSETDCPQAAELKSATEHRIVREQKVLAEIKVNLSFLSSFATIHRKRTSWLGIRKP